MSDDERKLIRKMLGSGFPNLQVLSDEELEKAVTDSLKSRDVIVQQAKNPPAASVEEKARRAYPDVQKPQDVYIKPVVVDGTITLPTQTRHTAGSQWLPLEEEP